MKHSLLIPTVIAIFLLFGCGTPEHSFLRYSPTEGPETKVPMTLALVLPPSVCSYAHSVGDIRPSVFYVGEAICRNIEAAARLNFQEVKVLAKAENAYAEDTDALLEIEMIDLKNYIQHQIPLLVEYRVYIEWSFSTKNGKSRYVTQLTGNGEDQRTFGYVHPRHRDSLQRCVDDLGRKVYEEMDVALIKGRKNLEAQRDILAKFEQYQIGITTLDNYEKDQTANWNIQFVRRESRSKKFADHTVETETYMKDKVRSAYGENLICELEFQGKVNNSREITLSSITCEMDGETVISK